MTLKKRLEKDFGTVKKCRPAKFALKDIRTQHPCAYSANDLIASNKVRCDYFVLCDWDKSITGIYVVEVKGGNPRVEEFHAQLQGGANFMESKLQQLQHGERFTFLPVLVAKSIPKNEYREWQTVRISMKGRKWKIEHVRKGGSLQKIPAENTVDQ